MARFHMAVTVADRTVAVTVDAVHTPPGVTAASAVTGLGADTEPADETEPPLEDALPFGFPTGRARRPARPERSGRSR